MSSSRLETIIRDNLNRLPAEPFIWWQKTWWSRGAFLELIEECEERLKTSNFKRGQRLALLTPNSPILLATAVAVWRLGGAVVLIDPRSGYTPLIRQLHQTFGHAIVPLGELAARQVLDRRHQLNPLTPRREPFRHPPRQFRMRLIDPSIHHNQNAMGRGRRRVSRQQLRKDLTLRGEQIPEENHRISIRNGKPLLNRSHGNDSIPQTPLSLCDPITPFEPDKSHNMVGQGQTRKGRLPEDGKHRNNCGMPTSSEGLRRFR